MTDSLPITTEMGQGSAAMERPALGAGHFGKLFGLAEDLDRLVRDLLAEPSETDDSASALDERDSEKRFELTQARRQRRLGYEASLGGAPEMAEAAQRDQILQLLDGWQVDDH